MRFLRRKTQLRKADQVADDLLRSIVSGQIEAGSLLPKESMLAAHYAVNRTVVREAIKLLEVHRLVQPVRRRGTVVLDAMASLSPEVLRAMIVPRRGEVDRAMLRNLLEIRATLDVQMSVLAAERRTDADLDALDLGVRRLRLAVGDPERYLHENNELALAVARATQNRIFEMLVAWHNTVVADLDHLFRTTRPATAEHAEGFATLVELIRRCETETVRSLVAAFHDWATPRLIAVAALEGGASLEQAMESAR